MTSIIIPTRGIANSKKRLRKKLDGEDVKKVILKKYSQIMSVLSQPDDRREIYLVIPKDADETPYVILSGKINIKLIRDQGKDLNKAIGLAVKLIKSTKKFDKILFMPPDLAWINERNIKFIESLLDVNDVIISPSLDGGTTLLAFNTNIRMNFVFGMNSFKRYLNQFKKKRFKHVLYFNKNVALDIDTIEDLNMSLKNPEFVTIKTKHFFGTSK